MANKHYFDYDIDYTLLMFGVWLFPANNVWLDNLMANEHYFDYDVDYTLLMFGVWLLLANNVWLTYIILTMLFTTHYFMFVI